MAIDSSGNLDVFYGTTNIRVSTYHPSTNVWTSAAIPDAYIYNNQTFGKIVTAGNFLFLPKNGNGESVRYDLTTGTSIVFGASINEDAIDYSIGPDGQLYVLSGAGVPSGDQVRVYNPSTLSLVRTISLNSFSFSLGTVRDLIVRPDGKMLFSDSNSGKIILTDSNGSKLSEYAGSRHNSIVDIAMGSDGKLAQFGDDHKVYLFDANMNAIQQFFATSATGKPGMGLIVPSSVPEPSSIVVIGIAAVGLIVRRRRNKPN